MKQTVTKSAFIDAFRNAGREDNFSYEGLCAPYEWLEEIGEETGQEVELDVGALCCRFSEYGSALECINDAGYDFEPDEDDDEDDQEDEALDWLRQRTAIITFPGGIIIQDF